MEDNVIFSNEVVQALTGPEPEQGLSQEVKARAKVLGKWMMLYFWMMLVPMIPGFIGGIESSLETGTIIGTVVGWVCSAVSVYILFQMGTVQRRLHTCAVLNLVALAGEVITVLLNNETVTNLWSVPGAVISLVAAYQFMHGCADALVGVDQEMSEKWLRLWKWFVGAMIALLVSVPLLLVAMMAENAAIIIVISILVIAVAVTVIVQSIREIVLTYRTAKTFRGIAANL